MSALSKSIAQAALEAARSKAITRPTYHSRIADKFVVRASEELHNAMADIGKLHGRSANSEITAAVMESLSGRQRTQAMRSVYVSHLGETLAHQVISGVAVFNEQASGRSPKVIRLPDGVRDAVKLRFNQSEVGRHQSMNSWLLDALVWWINNQRECYALLSACIAFDAHGKGEAPPVQH